VVSLAEPNAAPPLLEVPVRRRAAKLAVPAAALLLVLAPPWALSSAAQPIAVQDLPPELRPWVPWVLDELRELGCPRVQGRSVCVWPGRLELDLGPTGGTFSLDAHSDRANELRLPGSADRWPQDVRLAGAPAPLFDRGGAPHVRVGAGRHRLSGRFAWSRTPESLVIPPEIGLVLLRIDGRDVPRLRRENGGLLWLQARSEGGEEGESLRLQVFRRVADGIPMFVETRLQLEVAGRAREVSLPAAILPGTRPVAVEGDLPARVDDGTLRVQVRGGRYAVTVRARVEGQPKAIERPKSAGEDDWPAREVWVFEADERLRQVEVSGPPPIDPSRTELPGPWQRLPAFLVEPGMQLALTEVRRGQAEAPPDVLQLSREVWLDPDGRGASVRDRFGGRLSGTTRLDLLPPGTLGRVSLDGQDQLVTANPETKAAGVELRRESLRLEADSRLRLGGALPAVGWTTGVEQLQATLHLPPGWTVLGARGVDRLPGAWTSRWTLLAFFFVLVVTLAVHRLVGREAALVALLTLVLTYGESGAPFLVWLSLVAALALRRVAPAGRLATLARVWFVASAVLLLLILVPFSRDQLKDALFPAATPRPSLHVADGFTAALPASAPAEEVTVKEAVEGGVPGGVVGGMVGGLPDQAQNAAPRLAEEEKARLDSLGDRVSAQRPAVAPPPAPGKYQAYAVNQALEQDPKAVLQTGPGVPTWTWSTHALQWSGPVSRDHTLRLFLASPNVNRLLTLLRLGLLALLTAALLTGRWPRLPKRASPLPVAPLMIGALLLASPARATNAEEGTGSPSSALLEELKQRLSRPAPCEPQCVTTPSLVLRLGDSRLAVEAEVHAAAAATWTLPGPLGSWAASDVSVDGAPAVALAHLADGFLHLRLSAGVHRVVASGPVPPGDSFPLQFAAPPRRTRAEAPGWDVSGLRADGPPEASILLTRRLAPRTGAARGEGRYAPWLEVTRTLGFGVAWTVETRVRRVTARGTPVAVRIPLLAGEAPTRANLVVERGEAAVSLGGDETETAWQSTLEPTAKVTLRAPEGRPWSEVWRLQCSAIWPCRPTGLPPIARVADGVFTPEYRPWPGESLEVSLSHPEGVEGQTLTLDSVALEASPGTRLERAQITLTARSSREQPLVLRLPKEAELQLVTLDGRERPARAEGGELRVTVPAGTHAIEVRWQQPRGIGLFYALPRVALSIPAVNLTQQVTLPPNRWLLAARGPAWGPAVLFWAYLAFVIAVAMLLGRVPQSPLRTRDWVLLGLGLSQLPATGALVVVGFVFALAWRARQPLQNDAAFDLAQIGLAVWALVSLGLLYTAIQQGLLFAPDMQVAGNGSTDTVLRWYADRVSGELPGAGVLSLPLWVYRVGMLAWALWLAASLVRAVGWAWRAYGEGGLWRRLPLRRPRAASPPTRPPAQ
jgi:hypothetical protein